MYAHAVSSNEWMLPMQQYVFFNGQFFLRYILDKHLFCEYNYFLSWDELIKKHGSAQNKIVKIWWPDREVTIDGVVGFKQNKTDTAGTFMAPFDDIQIP